MWTALIHASVALAASVAAYQANPQWEIAARGPTGAIWKVGTNTIKPVEEGYPARHVKRAWLLIDYTNDKTEVAREARVMGFFDCVQDVAKLTTWIYYKADGTVLRDTTGRFPTYDPVEPGTVLSGVKEFVCDYNGDAMMMGSM